MYFPDCYQFGKANVYKLSSVLPKAVTAYKIKHLKRFYVGKGDRKP